MGLLCNIVACRAQQSGNADSHPEIFAPDHIQYFPDGPEFKLSGEAAQLKAARAEEKLQAKSHDDSAATDSIETDG